MKLKQTPEDFIVEEVPNITLTPKGSHLIFRLTKKEWNTEDAVQKICKSLNIARKHIGYSGSKDKQAVTTQYISISKISKEKVEKLKIKDVHLEYVGNASSAISLGHHLGNNFEITIRECKKRPKPKVFFINYFGEQRFSKNNSEIGKALIKKDFKHVCNLIIKNKGKNADKVAEFLKENKNNYLGALRLVPFRLLTLFIHSYQSELWNITARKLANGENKVLPMIGFATEIKDKEIKKIYNELMKKENIEKKDFVIKQWPELSSEGSERILLNQYQDLKITKIDNETYKVSFFLGKGSYATVAVQQLLA